MAKDKGEEEEDPSVTDPQSSSPENTTSSNTNHTDEDSLVSDKTSAESDETKDHQDVSPQEDAVADVDTVLDQKESAQAASGDSDAIQQDVADHTVPIAEESITSNDENPNATIDAASDDTSQVESSTGLQSDPVVSEPTDNLTIRETADTDNILQPTDGGKEAQPSADEETSDESEDESGSSEESEEEEGEDSDEDDDPEVEPRLKYSRITTLPKPVFNSDPVSACILSETFIAVATHGGFVHIYKPDLVTSIRSYRAHRASVLALATDGFYVGSASMDGTVVIGSVADVKDISASDFHRPVHTLALDPNYKSSKVFISGGMAGDVILSERNWLGSRSDTVIQHSDDPVTSVYWIDSLIICMDESGINVYGQHSREKLLHIDRPANSPRADLYKPRICSPESNRIYIAWVDRIWNIKISAESALTGANKTAKSDFFKSSLISSGASMILPSSSSIRSAHLDPQIAVEAIIQVDSLVAGISAFGEDTLMILSYKPAGTEEESNIRREAPPPELRLVDLGSGEEVYADELSLKGYERLGLNDYHLLQYSDSTSIRYFIISAKDGVVAVERTLNDRITWLLEHNSYQDAWDISANVKTPEERLNIGVEWVESLMNEENWSESATVLKRVVDALLDSEKDSLPISDIAGTVDNTIASPVNSTPAPGTAATDVTTMAIVAELTNYQKIAQENWNRWGFIFYKAGHSADIAKVLPVTPTLRVDPKVYEQIMTYFIDHDEVDEILKYLKLWPCDLYDPSVIKFRIEFLIKDDYELSAAQKKSLQKSLADLYVASGDPASAVNHLLALHDESVLDLVAQYHLLPTLKDRIPDLLTVSLAEGSLSSAPLPIIRTHMSKAISIVVRARNEVIPEVIVAQIMKRDLPMVAFLYLEQLTLSDSFASQSFGDLQVSLYADFDRPKLMGFLKKHNNYNLEKASIVCERLGYIPELVYILGKVGQNKQALKLVIEKLQDPEQAIDFAKAQKDAELWDDLIDYCLERPEFIRVLLKRASGSVDPIQVLNRIPAKMRIPGIRDAVLHIFSEFELVLSLNRGILDIVQNEAKTQATTLFGLRTRGLAVDFFGPPSKEGEASGDSATTITPADLSQLDFTGSIVIKPDGTLINEIQLIGEENIKHLWPQTSISVLSASDKNRSVSQKIKHLAYIKRILRSQL